nr:putative amino-acid permease c15c4.04c [Quercus suber]
MAFENNGDYTSNGDHGQLPPDKAGTTVDQQDMYRMGKRQLFKVILANIWLCCHPYEYLGGSTRELQLCATQRRTSGTDLDFRGQLVWFRMCDLEYGRNGIDVRSDLRSLSGLQSTTDESRAPTSGGQYRWFCVLGWQAGTAGQAFGTGLQIQGLISLNDATYIPHPWHSTLLAIAVVATAAVFNTLIARKLPVIENVMLVLHVIGFLAILVTLWITAPKAPSSEVWTGFTDTADWPTTGLAFCVGLTGSITSLIGPDAAVHMSEEIRDASWVVPQAMLWTLLMNGLAGLIMSITFAYCLGPLDAALQPEFGFAFIGTFYHATDSHAGTTFMTCIITLLTLCSVIANLAAGSRQLFAFARDQGLPFGRWLSHARWDLPLNAIAVTFTIASLLSLINLGSSVAFNAILSIGVVSLLSSYIVSISCVIIRRVRGEALLFRRWDLGVWGLPLNIIGLAYLTIIFVFTFFPLGIPVVASNMNWASAAYGGVAIFAALYYLFRHKIVNMLSSIVRFTDDAAAIEKTLRLFQSFATIYVGLTSSAAALELRRELALGRRYFRLFKWYPCFITVYGSFKPGRSSIEAVLDVLKFTFLGFYFLLEALTIDEANKCWFYALLASIALSLYYLIFTNEPSTEPAAQQSANGKPVDGGKQEKSHSSKSVKQSSKAAPSRHAVKSKLFTQLAIDGCDLLLPGSAVGWIPVDWVTVGTASTISTVLAGREIWNRVQSTGAQS